MMMNQLEDTMNYGPKPKNRPRWRTKNNRSLKKCVGEQRNYQSKIEMISVLSFGKCGERGNESLTYSQNAKTRLLSLLCPSSGLIEARLKGPPPIGPSHADAQPGGL